jgi:hypothetical protein
VHLERQREAVIRLSDGEDAITDLQEDAVSAFREGLTLDDREGLRRAESPARTADEQDPGARRHTMRSGPE